ncbi:hypothetical protein LX16_2813 [Stackebrandtia albiflava]|uniref:Uncharacterized protein n=1 Tax=Stackebrandtia albiflava TaxID=406432 RepID=A0A562V2I3_9ACTN|nr:hypothetical protein LX16_2813 [Stackebrandtia albiflava]
MARIHADELRAIVYPLIARNPVGDGRFRTGARRCAARERATPYSQ